MPILAEWLGDVEGQESLLSMLLTSATGAVITYIGLDLISRAWTVTYWDWPTVGTMSARSLSGQEGDYSREINLPYGRVQSVELVELYGEAEGDYIQRDKSVILRSRSRPWFEHGNNTDPAVRVEYTAGFGPTEDDVPDEIKQAILQLAAFNYEHRGDCDAMEAMRRSGAAGLLTPWRDARVMI